MGEGESCHIARSDMTAAFRNLGIMKRHWRYLIMKAKSPIDNKYYYFYDKALPFGSSISCSHFQCFSCTVAHLVIWRTGRPLVNYLDDYLFAALIRRHCNQQVQVFLQICERINFPVSLEKTFWGSTLMTFLGFLLDTINQRVCIPLEKNSRAINMIEFILSKVEKGKQTKVTVLQVQRICGFLNFLGHAVVPGRAFTRRLYSLLMNKNLKPHYHVRLNRQLVADLEMWLIFLRHQSAVSRPFMDFSKIWIADEILFYMDASKNFSLGFGGFCETSWMQQSWSPDLEILDPNIEYLELFALTAGILAWISRFENRRIILFTDNKSVMYMLNSTSTKCKNYMVLIRLIVLHCLVHNVRVYGKHVRSENNGIADSLSRFQTRRFNKLTKNMHMEFKSTPVPECIWPISKIWLKN